jgi:acyl-CoA synthetase (NDP forming)
MDRIDLEPLLNPRSVAVVGASGDPGKIGGRPVAYMQKFGFAGPIVPINPTRKEIQGLPCYPSLADAPQCDLAVIAAPGTDAKTLIEQCAAAGTKAIVLFSAGFAEVDPDGRSQQEELAAIATQAGIAFLGPNCLGVVNFQARLPATFATILETTVPKPGPFSYIGQSGALGVYWTDMVDKAGLGAAKWITTGNEAQISLADALSYLARDPDTEVIGAYVEDIKNPELFAAAAAEAKAAGKTVLAIKSGRSKTGVRAVAAHTGADAGDDTLYGQILRDNGVIRVASLSEMIDGARLALSKPTVKKAKRLGVVTVSGGAGVLICDAAADYGLEVPDLSAEMQADFRSFMPAFIHPQNPVDLTGAVVSNTALMEQALSGLQASSAFDGVVVFIGAMNSIAPDLVEAIRKAKARAMPIVVIWMACPETARAEMEGFGVPVFTEIPTTIAAIGRAV